VRGLYCNIILSTVQCDIAQMNFLCYLSQGVHFRLSYQTQTITQNSKMLINRIFTRGTEFHSTNIS